ncbi:MAG: aminotransferase class V-fold PLP-dependent enzyme [Acidobacteriota bacterium]
MTATGSEEKSLNFETRAVHAGGHPDPESGAIAPPIHLSTTFERKADGETPHGYGYIRETNPTQERLEAALATLDGGAASLAFSSGMAAGAAVAQSLRPGARIILTADSYYSFRVLASDFLQNWGIECQLVSMHRPDEVEAALARPADLVWAETPSNPLMNITDIREVAALAHRGGARLLVDGTFATPALQRPLEQGADIVLHSTTKYLGGHSDVQGGSLTFLHKDDFYERVLHVRHILGAVASPFNSWLVLRGIRSLSARMRMHCANASAVAQFLASHEAVEMVHYPGLPTDPGHGTASRQMLAFGGMVSFRVRGDRARAIAVVAATRIFVRATSLGGVESLIEHRASSEGPLSKVPENLIRLSVGLEHPDDLIDDLRQALQGGSESGAPS